MHYAVQDGCLYLHGTATVHTVTASVYRQFVKECSQANIHTLDLTGLQKADSACVSLLLAALRTNKTLTLNSLPNSVQALLELYEIQEWIHT